MGKLVLSLKEATCLPLLHVLDAEYGFSSSHTDGKQPAQIYSPVSFTSAGTPLTPLVMLYPGGHHSACMEIVRLPWHPSRLLQQNAAGDRHRRKDG